MRRHRSSTSPAVPLRTYPDFRGGDQVHDIGGSDAPLHAARAEKTANSWQVSPPSGLPERFQAPAAIRWGYFRNRDGARIRYSHVAVSPARAVVVLVPGYSEFGEKYFELMRDLVSQGYEIWQMDWRGYGGSDRYLSEREKAHSLGVDRDVRDLEEFVRNVVGLKSGKPLILVAQSMGAHLGTRYLHDYPGRLTAAVLSSPFFSLAPEASQGVPPAAVRAMVWTMNALGFGESCAKGNGPWTDTPIGRLSHDPVRADIQRQWNRSSPVLRIGGVSNRWVLEYLPSFDEMNKPGYYSAIKVPVLLGSASEDTFTRPDVHERACSEMADCRLVRLQGAWHELFFESEPLRSRRLKAVFEFLNTYSSP
jgi:lysophospholipase